VLSTVQQNRTCLQYFNAENKVATYCVCKERKKNLLGGRREAMRLLVPAKERERGIDTKGEKQLKSDIKINKQR
jgi:hypothetical protein